ncbi:MAG TPA: hypothetical protein VFR31_01765 [Thermoanaerobaculia bacterium]|nr:hypothetical protein [Thermoanaerobaculia bacterium]
MDRLVHIRALALGLVLGLLASTATAQRDTVLGAGGELYQVTAGAYGGLFPGGRELSPNTPVLVLDVSRPGKDAERILVPWSKDADIEGSPSLIFEDSSNTVFLVCETRRNSIHSILELSSYDASGTWSEPIEIAKNSTSLKTSPQLAVTRDSYTDQGTDGQPITRSRLLFHVIWAEEFGTDSYRTFYMPLLVEDGHYIKSDSVFDLNEFDKSLTLMAPQSRTLARNPVIQEGRDGRTVVVAFNTVETGRLTVVEIDSLPAELSLLADGARAQIIDLGARHSYPKNLQALAEKVHDSIVGIGGAFHPEVVESVADMVYGVIMRQGGDKKGIVPLAGEARAQIIDLGAKLSGRGLRGSTAASTDLPAIETVKTSSNEQEGALPSHLVQFRVTSSRVAPETGDTDLRLFVSRTGEHVLVAWLEKGKLHYRISDEEGWSNILQLPVSPNVDLPRAYEILEQRVRNR